MANSGPLNICGWASRMTLRSVEPLLGAQPIRMGLSVICEFSMPLAA